jgi:hypothetical protein
MYGVIPACVRAVPIARIQAIELYRSKLRWDLKVSNQRDNLQLLLNQISLSTLDVQPTTLGGALLRHTALTPMAVALDTRQPRFVAWLASQYQRCMSKALSNQPNHAVPVGSVAMMVHTRIKMAETMGWPDVGEEPAVKTTIQEYDAIVMKATELLLRRPKARRDIALRHG